MLKKALCLFLFACIIFGACAEGFAAVTAAPSSFSIARGQASIVTLQYVFSNVNFSVATPVTSGVLTSTNGTFFTRDRVLGTNPVTLVANIRSGSGTAAESVVIPVAIVERALSSGTATFFYRRSFPTPIGVETATVQIRITSEAAASFNVKRIELYFDNRRAETTVPRYFPNLRAYADIRYTGSGLLEGYWEADGRIISRVYQMLTFGGITTLQSPDIPPLPTFDPGSHIVRFVATNQDTGLPIPALVYFVTTDDYRARFAIGTQIPRDASTIERASARFAWESDGASLFLVQYYEDPESKPVFSAYTREAFYLLPQPVFKDIFAPGEKYYWKVTGYNDKNNVIGESATRSFIIK
jgi:hypothetical protein